MLAYIVRRILWAPVLLFFAALFVFVMGEFAPGDPIEVALGQSYTVERADRLREIRGLNQPVAVRFIKYIGNAVKLDFGESLSRPDRSVWELLSPKLKVSGQLFLAGILISVIFGIPLGYYAASKQGAWIDPTIVGSTLVLMAIPVFLTAPLLILVFAVNLGWLPVGGWDGFFSTRIILPALVTGIPGIAGLTRMMRASTLDVLGQDYVRTARSKGLDESVIRRRHVARNAMIPVLTILGFAIAGLFSGSLITELIFGIPGVSSFALQALSARDFPVITTLALIGAGMLVLVNLLVDIMYAVIDPRITYD
ncbi:MAG: ABC transporter permease [Chloroflexi bacterium]|nr:ABC transporter permease [Chloroflexota bacterium]